MERKGIINTSIKILLPLILGSGILYWMYRDFDFKQLEHVLWEEMDWTWMLLSLPFGALAEILRGLRWRQILCATGEKPRRSSIINSIFLSYAASLIVPRVGEFLRCGVLKRYDGISFTKALGTVVSERAVDIIVMLLVTSTTMLLQFGVFTTFFEKTGTNIDGILSKFSSTGYLVTAICALAVVILLHLLLKRLSIYNKVKTTFAGVWQGVKSIGHLSNVPLFILLSFGIWASYFIHYYITFFCFDFTSDLGVTCGLVTFVVGSIAVLVPTPNGAGPWHFAVKTMLILYGVAEVPALYFVLIVHTVQTLLIMVLGIISMAALAMTKKENSCKEQGS
jgi:uncharacterized protein (TIRG00374 family)